MSTTSNLSLIVTKVPTGLPVPGEHITVKDVGPFDLSQAAPANGVVLETLYVSFDPYLRGLLRDPAVKSYSPAIPVGSPLIAGSLSKVLRSNLAEFKEGDIFSHTLPVQQYNVFVADKSADRQPRKITPAPGIDLRHYLGALGMPGLTAYSSLYELGKPKKGETIVVSSAAGAVGQLVGQLAKHEGLKVIGSVGSDDKLAFIVDELGFDDGWNYKKEKSTKEVIERLTNGEGIDIFYDNVGGEQLEGALETIKVFGR